MTVDPALVEAGNHAVSAGLADSMSSWVNEALMARSTRDAQRRALSEAILDFESHFGEITREEMDAQRRTDREDAVVVRKRRSNTPPATRPGTGAA